jgi:ABC-type transporter Mla subunit MlaD
MQKQAPTLGRLLVMVGFALSCFGLLLFLWLAFGGPIPLKPKGYRFHASFGEATQLAKEADVRISGVSVGKVKNIVNDKQTGRSDATIELKPGYAPLPKDSKAILRQKTLLGETYVELSPGNKANGTIPEDGKLRLRRCRRPWSSTRSSARSTPRPARRSRPGCRRRPRGSGAAVATSTTRWATWRRSPPTPATS